MTNTDESLPRTVEFPEDGVHHVRNSRRSLVILMLVTSLVVVVSAASSKEATATSRVATRSSASARGLRAAAVAWATAYLTGTAKEMKNLQGPECLSHTASSFTPQKIAATLHGLRAAVRRQIGRPLDTIKIRGVLVRNVTNTSGEAEVQYNLPQSSAGNDNWVEYKLHQGRWKVADCHAPILGYSGFR